MKASIRYTNKENKENRTFLCQDHDSETLKNDPTYQRDLNLWERQCHICVFLLTYPSNAKAVFDVLKKENKC